MTLGIVKSCLFYCICLRLYNIKTVCSLAFGSCKTGSAEAECKASDKIILLCRLLVSVYLHMQLNHTVFFINICM